MIEFEEEFRKSAGLPFEIHGKFYRLTFPIATEQHLALQVRFVTARTDWRQGVRLDCKQSLMVNNQKSKAIVLWHDTAPAEVRVTCPANEIVHVRNVWDVGNGTEHSWHGGAAMFVESIGPSHWRLSCNDGHIDDACDDLVVEVQLT